VPEDSDLEQLPTGTELSRVHFLAGDHPSRWSDFQTWGPSRSRFDHHPLPPDEHFNFGIIYVALGGNAFTAAIAETFQDSDCQRTGPIDRRLRRPVFTMFDSAESFLLLNLNSGWITRGGKPGDLLRFASGIPSMGSRDPRRPQRPARWRLRRRSACQRKFRERHIADQAR
jgi:hypothetical protein